MGNFWIRHKLHILWGAGAIALALLAAVLGSMLLRADRMPADVAVADRPFQGVNLTPVPLVHIADAVYDYIVELVDATRSSELVELGVSPRGALALCRMAKAHAFVRGGDFVTPEDVYQVFDDVCAHRLVLSAKARLGKITAREITEQLRQQVPVPQVAQL